VKTVMSNMGRALMGTGCAKGQGRARLAAEMAITSPLLDNISVEGAMGVLINIVGGPDMRMKEIEEAATLVQEQAHEDANIIFGATIDETMGDMIKVTVIATGFELAGGDSVVQHSATAIAPAARGHHATVVSTAPSLASPLSSALTSPSPRSMPAQAPTQRTPPREPPPRDEPAYTVRRTAPPQAAPASLSAGSTPRERSTFVPPLDADWDTPAFQRRGQ
jgi:cell division protein FtsZ